jgi:hypothetical protein
MTIFTIGPMNQGNDWAARISEVLQILNSHLTSRHTTSNIPQGCFNLRRVGAMRGCCQPNGGFDAVEFEDAFDGSFAAVESG